MAAARTLLDTTGLSVGEIAQRTGFLSSNTFIKTFKNLEGLTPAAYRGRG